MLSEKYRTFDGLFNPDNNYCGQKTEGGLCEITGSSCRTLKHNRICPNLRRASINTENHRGYAYIAEEDD